MQIKLNENTGKVTKLEQEMEMRVNFPNEIYDNAPGDSETEEGKELNKKYYESITFDDLVKDGKIKVSFTEILTAKERKDRDPRVIYMNYEHPETIKVYYENVKTVLIVPVAYEIKENVKGATIVKVGE